MALIWGPRGKLKRLKKREGEPLVEVEPRDNLGRVRFKGRTQHDKLGIDSQPPTTGPKVERRGADRRASYGVSCHKKGGLWGGKSRKIVKNPENWPKSGKSAKIVKKVEIFVIFSYFLGGQKSGIFEGHA